MKSIVLHIIVLLTLYLARECQAVKINKISVPSYFDLHSENKNQPLILECDYDTDDDDTGVVLKWLLNSVSIYQWIPLNTVNPTGLKSFKNRIDLEYNKDLPEKQRYSTLVIKNPTIADTGNYSCDVQTFKSHDRKTAPITIVYVDDSIKLNYFIDEIENQVNFECSINQIYPLPEVTFLIGNEARNFSSPLETHVFTNIYHNISVSAQINKEEIEDDEEVTCLVRIPTIDYEKKASVHYDDPNHHVVTNETVIGKFWQDINDENYGHMIRANLLLSIIMYLILLMIKSMAF